MRVYIDLHVASPFDSDVIAYPSIFVISRGKTSKVDVFTLKTATPEDCNAVRATLASNRANGSTVPHATYETWFSDKEPWILSSPDQLKALRELEEKFQLIEADGDTKIKIGVATGCDRLYIVDKNVKIERDRLLPLVMRADLDKGTIKDANRCVINMFDRSGDIVDLSKYPLLRAYLEEHASEIKKRHVAQKNERSWFRTIDRVYPEFVFKPKLLIPDIAGSNEVTFDSGKYFPHHNLYFVLSDSWDMEVLGGLLSSRLALFFVWSYAVKMRGGYLRFQAQYLRRIRVPQLKELSPVLASKIKEAFRSRNFKELDRLALKAYRLETLPDFDFVDTRA